MKALAYLLGARALDIANDAEPSRRRLPEPPLAPLATTEETASAWRRWAARREADVAAEQPRPAPQGLAPRPSRSGA